MKKILLLLIMTFNTLAFDTGWSGKIYDRQDLVNDITSIFVTTYKTRCSSRYKDTIYRPTFEVAEAQMHKEGAFSNIIFEVKFDIAPNGNKEVISPIFDVTVELDEYTGEYRAEVESLDGLCEIAPHHFNLRLTR
jgi:hypothetical protein